MAGSVAACLQKGDSLAASSMYRWERELGKSRVGWWTAGYAQRYEDSWRRRAGGTMCAGCFRSRSDARNVNVFSSRARPARWMVDDL